MTTEQGAEYRLIKLDEINTQIFQLVYYGKFSYLDCENMTSVELKWFFNKLLDTKKAENKAQEDAIKEAQNRAKQKR